MINWKLVIYFYNMVMKNSTVVMKDFLKYLIKYLFESAMIVNLKIEFEL